MHLDLNYGLSVGMETVIYRAPTFYSLFERLVKEPDAPLPDEPLRFERVGRSTVEGAKTESEDVV